MKRGHTLKVAFSGILIALALLFICLGGILPAMTYAMPALGGLMLIPAVVELGPGWAWPVYFASSVLGVLLGPDKSAAVLFLFFFGYYPIVKALLEHKVHSRLLCLLFKLLLFNAAAIVAFYISVSLLNVPKMVFSIAGIYLPGVLLLLANFVFLLYDYAVGGVAAFYFSRLHRFISKWLIGNF
ncbi:hypothetical protein B6259_05680 [Ruminococcaceae bacterium CPB6]|nr:hypothetical protein B6259_05680 [Ruminococcaceae bacterium CPB6]